MAVELNKQALEVTIDRAHELTKEMSGGVHVPREATAYITTQVITAWEEAKLAFAEGV